MSVMRDYDVIVVGAGAAGLAAALAAAKAGASVLVADAGERVGGSSRLSGGHFYAAGTTAQREAGIADDADAMFEHYMTLNQWMVDPAVVRRYCDLSAPTFEWIRELGVEFPAAGVYVSGVGSVPRGHQPEGAGEAVVQVLEGHCQKHGVEVLLDARVDRLLEGSAGTVSGIAIGPDKATSGAVILATGGFGANQEMLERFYPQAVNAGDWRWYIGTESAQGDGIALGESVGAVIDGHGRGLLLTTPGFSRDLEVLLPGWLILVNRQGHRFVDEAAPYSVLGGVIERQGGAAFAVFDEAARAGAKPSPMSQAYWVDDVLARKADEGRIHRAMTLEALAQSMAVDVEGLSGTVQRYNADVQRGSDGAYFKTQGLAPIAEAPFYGVEVRPAIVCWTGAGVRIDAQTRVLNKREAPISGLYAAGETVGNLHGDRYIGGGGSFGPCLVFGKLAGEQAAAYVLGANE